MRWAGLLGLGIACGLVGCGRPIGCSGCGGGGILSLSGPATSTFTKTDPTTYILDFGPVALGHEKGIHLSTGDLGPFPLVVINVSTPTDPEFGAAPLGGNAIQAGSTADFPVTFKPFSDGPKNATVTIQTDSPVTPTVTLNLTGTGVDLKLIATPISLDFGTVVVHSTPSLPVTVTNTTAVDFTLTPGPIQGSSAPLFSMDLASAVTLAAFASQALTVSYSPLVPSIEDTASFVLASSTGENVTVSLRGVAIQSRLSVSPYLMDFNFVHPGAWLTKPLTIRNNSSSVAVTITSASVLNSGSTPAAFSSTPFDGTLDPGQQAEVMVTFQPVADVFSRYTGELDILSTDSLNQIPLALVGCGGGAAITCSPRLLDFGAVKVNSSATRAVTCTNIGTDILTTNGAIDPTAELSFERLQSSGSVFSAMFNPPVAGAFLKAGESIHIDVSYFPTAVGVDTGTLTVVTNVTNPPAPPVITLSGSGE